jgi:AcrR family transcriptional regulator
MAKYGAELTEKIVDLIEDEFFTVSQVCKATGISRQTFYFWMDTKDDFRREIEQAMARREAEMMTMVQASLKKKLEGYYTTVEKDIYVPNEYTGEVVFKQKTITKKECPPDLRTIKMLLDRQDKKTASSGFLPKGEKKSAKECTIQDEAGTLEKIEEPDNDMEQKPAEEILETCAEAITEFPPKNEHIEREMKVLTSSQKRKAEHKKKKNMTTEKIKKSVRFVRF